MKSREAERSAR